MSDHDMPAGQRAIMNRRQMAEIETINRGAQNRENKLRKGNDMNRLDAVIGDTDYLGKATRERLSAGLLPQESFRRIDYYSFDPIRPQWAGQGEWQSSRGSGHTPFEGEREWGNIRPQDRGRVGKPVRDDASERRSSRAMPMSGTAMEHITDGELVTSAKELEARAYAQIRELLAERRRTGTGPLG